MKDLVILGSGGFAKEVAFLVETDAFYRNEYNILGFIDNYLPVGSIILGKPVIGDDKWLLDYGHEIYAVCAVGKPESKYNIVEKFLENKRIIFPNIISSSAIVSEYIDFGMGNIICAGTILTVDIKIGDFVTINLDCTIGHDSIIDNFSTLHPSVNVSGNVKIGKKTEIGTGTNIIQGTEIGDNVIVGAGTVIIRNIESNSTVVGNPGKKIK